MKIQKKAMGLSLLDMKQEFLYLKRVCFHKICDFPHIIKTQEFPYER